MIHLPEHTVVACYGLGSGFTHDFALLNCIAEIRMGREYADFFDALPSPAQIEFIDDLLRRATKRQGELPCVCVLDTGLNRGHPAIEPFVSEQETRTIKSTWGSADDDNHGTLMAGVCLFGDLAQVLGSTQPLEIPFHLESTKIVPPPQERGTDEKLAGYYTAQGVAVAEAAAPQRQRVWCLSTTMRGPNPPLPTSWSAQLDGLAVGLDNGGAVHRLFCISGGNVPQQSWLEYPDANLKHEIQNPGQSWNALCVGACTHFDQIRPENDHYTAIASRGSLAPCSSCSHSWDDAWPNKPDVVFEAGNAGFDSATNSTLELPEMLPLSTAADFRQAPLCTFSGTSAAVAGVARMAGHIASEYPDFWTETIRGLIVHSAEWTPAMEASVPAGTPSDRARFLLRTAGYGVPRLAKALETASNRATLIAQSTLQPFRKKGAEVLFNEMHLHALPWPTAALGRHAAETIRLRVTLSYFIEPNPGNRGYTSTYSYPGCQLRFKVSSPGQSAADLEAEVSKVAAEAMNAEGRKLVKGSTDGWRIGQSHRNRGSIHSDFWEGSCADLLSMRHVAVYPVTGWWRTRPSRGKTDAKLRYSLIVTIESQNPAIDVATEIETAIATVLQV